MSYAQRRRARQKRLNERRFLCQQRRLLQLAYCKHVEFHKSYKKAMGYANELCREEQVFHETLTEAEKDALDYAVILFQQVEHERKEREKEDAWVQQQQEKWIRESEKKDTLVSLLSRFLKGWIVS